MRYCRTAGYIDEEGSYVDNLFWVKTVVETREEIVGLEHLTEAANGLLYYRYSDSIDIWIPETHPWFNVYLCTTKLRSLIHTHTSVVNFYYRSEMLPEDIKYIFR